MLAGFELAETLPILDQWDSMTETDRAAILARLSASRPEVTNKSLVDVSEMPSNVRAIRGALLKKPGDPL